jgi:antibiotic biosynthesis monooxygenase (ABM) superfamily enzyme
LCDGLHLRARFDVKQGKAQEFQKWLSENEGKLAAAMPSGVEYIGTFGVVFTSEKHAGRFRYFLRLDSYAAQDALAVAMRDGDFETLLAEGNQFIDQDRGADWSNGLYKAVTDLSMLAGT